MPKFRKAALAALLSALAVAVANAQDYDGYPDSDDIRQTVARVSYISGDVSFARGDDPDEWQPADANIPLTLGDRTWTAGGKLELEVHGGNIVRLAGSTDLTALNLTEDTKQFSMSAGVASFQIRRLGDNEVFEVDTPNAAITFEGLGDYRIDVRQDGGTRIQVRRGRAMIASGGGQVPLNAGDAILVEGFEPPRYDFVRVSAPDGWDRWVAGRDTRYANVRSYQYVSPDIAGVQDLDRYGRWSQVPNYGWCWSPASVAAGWRPYRAGRWIWQDPWGWTWVSTEPWGWAPYHYGRWIVHGPSWYWVPVAPRVAVVAYSPALVAFVGGGPGFSVSVGLGGADYIGWFPLAPRDPLVPWWGRPAAVNVQVTNITYVNRTYITVVNQNTFVTSRSVTNNYVRDRSIVNRVEQAPVVRGAIPIVPTHDSIRVASRSRAVVRPPATAASHSVVTRVAPPPAPARFDQKVAVIRENRGRPVTAAESQTIVTRESRTSPQPSRAVRPATADSGRVTLAPKNDNSRAPQPEPVAPSRGRPLATKEQPVAIQPEGGTPARERQQTRPEPQARPESQRPESPTTRPEPQARPESQRPESPTTRPQAQPQVEPQTRPQTRPQAQPQAQPQTQAPQAEPAERRPAPRPTSRSAQPVPQQQQQQQQQQPSSRERSSDRPTAAPPQAAPHASTSTSQRPTPRGDAQSDRSQPRASAPRAAEQPPPQAAPPPKSGSTAVTPSSDRGRGRPQPTKTPKND